MSEPSSFPVFDLGEFEAAGPERKIALGREVDAVCRSTGFLAVGGHGVGQSIINDIWDKTGRFFELPAAAKQKAKAPYAGYPYGYLAPETESLAKSRGEDSPPDLKESFNGGPLAIPGTVQDPEALEFCYADTVWPDGPEGFVDAWKAYYAAMEDLAARIMRAFAVALYLPEDYFDRYIDAPISALRALNYPIQSNVPRPGQFRAGAHTDYGSLTILLPQEDTEGLEILSPGGDWIAVPPVPGAFIVNIGDLMARWTNDRWVSTLHRVVNPATGGEGSGGRRSLAFFHQPNWDAEIECLECCLQPGDKPKYDPVRSGPYLMSKFKSTTMSSKETAP